MATCIIHGGKFQPRYKTTERCCYDEECMKKYRKMMVDASKEKQSLKKPDLKLKKIYKIPMVSKKRAVENAKYSVLKIEFMSKPENKICKITGSPTTEVHHTYSGKDRAKYFLDTSTWLAVSRDGHNWIHSNPKEARELGYLK